MELAAPFKLSVESNFISTLELFDFKNDHLFCRPTYLLELEHVPLHRQSRAVDIPSAVHVRCIGIRRFPVLGGLPGIGPVGPGDPEGPADVPGAKTRRVAVGYGLADAPQA